MTYRPIQPVAAVLDDEHLPAPVRPAAAEWRSCDEAVMNAQLRVAEAQNIACHAPAADRRAVEAAVLEGAEPVSPDAHQRRAQADLSAAEAALELMERSKVRTGEVLLSALIKHRDALAVTVKQRADVAVTAYEKALTNAEQTLRVAAAAVTEATSGLGTLADLDGDPRFRYEIACMGRQMTPPSFVDSRRDVALLRADISHMVTPQNRLTVQTTDGSFIEFSRDRALTVVAEHGAQIVDPDDLPADAQVVAAGLPD